MSALSGYLHQQVAVITTDGRFFTGLLKGYDHSINIILSGAQERVIYEDDTPDIIDLGVYMLRGETVATCGLVDQEIESQIDWTKVRGKALKDTKNRF